MRTILKWLLRLGILAIVLIVILLLSLDSIIKSMAERRIRAQTGMDVKIGKVSVGLLSPVVTIENLKLYNTSDFGDLPFLEIKELHVEYDREALARQKIRLKLVRLDIAELDVVKNEHGQTNIFGLIGDGGSKLPEQTKRELEQFEFGGVEVLNVSVGKLRFIDLKNPKKNRDLDFNLKNQVFKNVRSEDDLKAVLILLWLRSGVGGGMLGVENSTGAKCVRHRA